MIDGGQFNQPIFNQVPYNYGTVESVEGKYHVKIAGIGFMLTRDVFSGRHNYGRDQAPTFVNKFGAGDSTYRDSSFFPHWVQFNWRNGAKQDEWDDEGRYLTSKNIDITTETKITLSKLLSSLLLVAGSVDVICMAIDYSDSNKVFAGCSNGHVWRYTTEWTDMGDITSNARRINCLFFSKIGGAGARVSGSGQMYAGVGTPGTAGGAELFRYDGSWASAAKFIQYDAVTAIQEFNSAVYIALGGTAVIKTSASANLASLSSPAACSAALVASAGNINNGAHLYKVTLVNSLGETELGTASNSVTADAGHGQVNLTSIPTGATGTTARRVYRTKAGGSVYYLLTTISDNTTTTFTDNIADATLTTEGTGIENSTAWALSKNIDYPGYIWSMVVYNQRLYAGGGHPENSPTVYQLGTLWSFDGYLWGEVGPFNGTVIRSLCVYDNLLFIGTIHGQLYVYNRANIDMLYEMPDGNGIFDMVVYKDKLYMAVRYRETNSSENAVYIFDRAGTHKAHYNASIIPSCLLVNGDNLWIGGKDNGNAYSIDSTKYNDTGELQSSYYNANLPNIDKVWFDVSVEMDSLPDSGKVEIYYKTDESDAAWTKIDETTEAGKKLAIFALPEGTYSKKLSYKIILTTTDDTETPTVKKILFRYIIQPNFKYLWKFKIACPDNIEYIDGSQPISFLSTNTAQSDAVIYLNDATGFPDPGGDKMYASIEDSETGEKNEFSYTGVDGNTLTGCVSVAVHDISTKKFIVAVRGRHFHKKILELKQRKAIVEYIDIDSLKYRVIMHDYSEDGWVINSIAGLENETAITLLEA